MLRKGLKYPMSSIHCANNQSDREKGQYWEKCFCNLAGRFGFVFTPLQIGRNGSAVAYELKNGSWNYFTLPDVTIWSSPSQHHEIKHKSPTNDGCYGLEVYRFDALMKFYNLTKQKVMYTIHNHSLNGGTNNRDNYLEHWFTVDISNLNQHWDHVQLNGTSWINGEKRENIQIYYWSSSLWQGQSLQTKGAAILSRAV